MFLRLSCIFAVTRTAAALASGLKVAHGPLPEGSYADPTHPISQLWHACIETEAAALKQQHEAANKPSGVLFVEANDALLAVHVATCEPKHFPTLPKPDMLSTCYSNTVCFSGRHFPSSVLAAHHPPCFRRLSKNMYTRAEIAVRTQLACNDDAVVNKQPAVLQKLVTCAPFTRCLQPAHAAC